MNVIVTQVCPLSFRYAGATLVLAWLALKWPFSSEPNVLGPIYVNQLINFISKANNFLL